MCVLKCFLFFSDSEVRYHLFLFIILIEPRGKSKILYMARFSLWFCKDGKLIDDSVGQKKRGLFTFLDE